MNSEAREELGAAMGKQMRAISGCSGRRLFRDALSETDVIETEVVSVARVRVHELAKEIDKNE